MRGAMELARLRGVTVSPQGCGVWCVVMVSAMRGANGTIWARQRNAGRDGVIRDTMGRRATTQGAMTQGTTHDGLIGTMAAAGGWRWELVTGSW
jgi:hypothetical protein